MQNLNVKLKISTNTTSDSWLWSCAGSRRFVWNYFLKLEIDSYERDGKFRFYTQNSADLTKLKRTDEFAWLNSVPATSLQQALRDLDKALNQFLKDRKSNKSLKRGFPQVHRKKYRKGSFKLVSVCYDRNIKIINGKSYFKICGWLHRLDNHREIPKDFKSAMVVFDGKYWQIVFHTQVKKMPKKSIVQITGIDLNSKEFVTTDQRYPIPKPFLENQKKLKELQRTLSRRVKGSINYRKCLDQLQKLNRHCRNIMLDYFHKLSRRLVDCYDLITIEDLDVKAIQKKFGKLVQNNGFSVFRSLLEYKAELTGTNLVIANRYFPSSQTCSGCGKKQKLKLSDRRYQCECGLDIDRDENAAINLSNYGVELHRVNYDRSTSELTGTVFVI